MEVMAGARSPRVSLITPTRDRHALLPFAYRWATALEERSWEWVILDDSDRPCPFLASLSDPRVRYVHLPRGLTLGAKRNEAVALARGRFILHLDDDDYYAPGYVAPLLEALDQDVGLAKLGSWFVYSVRERVLGHVDMTQREVRRWELSGRGVRQVQPRGAGLDAGIEEVELETPQVGWGFSFAYRRETWERCPFPDVDWNEDGGFATEVVGQWGLATVADTTGLCLHLVHPNSASASFPDILLPHEKLQDLFPHEVEDLIATVGSLSPRR
jgi:glycosyltransferase involved in cell wall biosynthesis